MPNFDPIIDHIQKHLGFYTKHPKVRVVDENGKPHEGRLKKSKSAVIDDSRTEYYGDSTERSFTNCVLLFAFNGTGKTRLSYEFAHRNRVNDQHHTLYYNAFTEDLFSWHNDLDADTLRYMVINTKSELIQGLAGYNYDDEINKYLSTLTGFKAHFETNYHDEEGKVVVSDDNIPREVWFSRELSDGTTADYIKISRGEERLFVWCVFRFIMQLVISHDPRFSTIKYIYIDDPMSSLDDNNVILFASQLFELINACHKDVYDTYLATNIQSTLGNPYFVISTHHTAFFNTMRNGLKGCYCLNLYRSNLDTEDVCFTPIPEHTPAFYHLQMLAQIKKELDAHDQGQPCNLQRYHFNVMRGIVEQFAQVMGQSNRQEGPLGHVLDGIVFHFNGQEFQSTDADVDGFERLHANALNVLSHTSNTMLEPTTLNSDNIQLMQDIYNHLVTTYKIQVPDLN